MNKRQLIALWAIGLLLCIGLLASTYNIKYINKPKPNTIEELMDPEAGKEPGWHISKVNRIDIVSVNLVRYVSPILIIGGLLLYSLRSKNK